MSSNLWFWIVLLAVIVLVIGLVSGLVIARKRKISLGEPDQQEAERKPKAISGHRRWRIALPPAGRNSPLVGETAPARKTRPGGGSTGARAASGR